MYKYSPMLPDVAVASMVSDATEATEATEALYVTQLHTPR
jgi:hypothetical protein